MTPAAVAEAASLLRSHWTDRTRIDAIPAGCRPADRAEGYAVQAALAAAWGHPVVAWKIAATSAAGQAHIGVDGPLAGRYLRDRVLAPGASVPLDGNTMRVAEVEFAFRMARDLPPRAAAYTLDETMAAVASLHPSVEVPDSRYQDFVHAGAPQLIADCACACWLVIGEAAPDAWRAVDLASHPVRASVGGRVVAEGTGAAALGDPRTALLWIANELRVHGPGLRAGEWISTGTCVVPVPVAPGDAFVADYGALGSLALTLR
ncbi:MAG: hypothetical protein RJA99_1622 [Pseudomonadota bacterium]|jgi:2-keto-4-pentenoate hydratase